MKGFGGLTNERRRAIAAKGGRSAHAQGKAHRFTTAEASRAGRLGGRASTKKPGQPLNDALAVLEAYIETTDVSRPHARRALQAVRWHLNLRDQVIATVDRIVKDIRAKGPVRTR